MTRKKCVILSSPSLLTEGVFLAKHISLAEAKTFVRVNEPVNFSCHPTVKVLGVQPAKYRKACGGYDIALIVKPKKRLQQQKNYSLRELIKIGFTCLLIERLQDEELI